MSRAAAERADCRRCPAICCRLTVLLRAEDAQVPRALVERTASGVEMMARGADGYCVALAADRSGCTIYAERPRDCRSFVMDGAYCRSERADEAERLAAGRGLRRRGPAAA